MVLPRSRASCSFRSTSWLSSLNPSLSPPIILIPPTSISLKMQAEVLQIVKQVYSNQLHYAKQKRKNYTGTHTEGRGGELVSSWRLEIVFLLHLLEVVLLLLCVELLEGLRGLVVEHHQVPRRREKERKKNISKIFTFTFRNRTYKMSITKTLIF